MRTRVTKAIGAAVAALVWAAPAAATPQDLDVDFCRLVNVRSVAMKSAYAEDPLAGVATTASVVVPRSGGWLGVYFSNDGPGDITITAPPLVTAEDGSIPMTTRIVAALAAVGGAKYWDGGWTGTFPEESDFVGCVFLYPEPGVVRLELPFTRGAAAYSKRVDVNIR